MNEIPRTTTPPPVIDLFTRICDRTRVGYRLDDFQRLRCLDDGALASWLRTTPTGLARLRVCAVPWVLTWPADLLAMADWTGADVARLAWLLRALRDLEARHA